MGRGTYTTTLLVEATSKLIKGNRETILFDCLLPFIACFEYFTILFLVGEKIQIKDYARKTTNYLVSRRVSLVLAVS